MKSPADVSDLIHDVLPRLPDDALELFEHLSVIGENADLAQDLAACLRDLRAGAAPAPALGPGFADAVLAALPEAAPAACEPEDHAADPSRPSADSPSAESPSAESPSAESPSAESPSANPGSANPGSAGADPAELIAFPQPPRPLLWSQLAAAGLLLGCGVLLGLGLRPPAPRLAHASPTPSERPALEPTQRPTLVPGPSPAGASPGAQQPALAREPSSFATQGAQLARARSLPTPPELQAYVVEASYVLEAIDTSDDPRLARALAVHLRRTALVEQGERLLSALRYDPQQRQLRPLIQGTQLVLRKVQHAPRSDAAPLHTIRHEVRRTKLLDACRDLIVASLEPEPAPPPPAPREGLGPF